MKYIMTMIALAFTNCMAFAQDVLVPMPEDVSELGGVLDVIAKAFENSNSLIYGAGIALIITLLFKKYALPKLNLGSGILPVISLVVGAVAGISLAIMNKVAPEEAMLAMLSGPAASSLWDAIFKYFFKKE